MGLVLLLVAPVALAGFLGGACSDDRRLDRDLRSQDPEVRAGAVRRLAERRPGKAPPVLIRMLEDREPRVRVEAATALGVLKVREAARPLGTLLGDMDSRVRLAAVEALFRLGREAAEDDLLGAVMDSDRLVRRTARNRLADLGLPRSEQERRVALQSLAQHRRGLLAQLSERRLAAVRALGQSGRPEVVRDLEKRLTDPYVAVAGEAAEALGMVGTPEAMAALERLADHSEHGRSLALRGQMTMLRARHEGAGKVAERMLSHADPEARRLALAYLLEPAFLGRRPVSRVLCSVLQDPEPRWAVEMAEALLEAGVACGEAGEGGSGTSGSAPWRGGKVPGESKDASTGSLRPGDVVATLTRKGPLDAPVRAWVSQRLALVGPSPDPIALAVAVSRGDDPLRRQGIGRVQQAYEAVLEASERWLDEAAWKRIDSLRVEPGSGAELMPHPRPVATGDGAPGSPSEARTKRARQLTQLMDRFPERRDPLHEELLPPTEDPANLVWCILRLSALDEARPWLAALASRSPAPLRLAAVQALGSGGCHDEPCRSAMERALKDKDVDLRVTALAAISSPDKALVDELVALLRDDDHRVRAAAAAALARGSKDSAWPALLAAFRKSREAHLVEAFGILGDRRAEPVLLGILREDPPPVDAQERLAVLEALARVGTSKATERLLAELEHPEPALRRGAALVLGLVGDQRALSALLVCAQDFFAEVRLACERARERVTARIQAEP